MGSGGGLNTRNRTEMSCGEGDGWREVGEGVDTYNTTDRVFVKPHHQIGLVISL